MQYQVYTLEQAMKRTQEEKEDLFMKNYVRCLESGFSHEQILALFNLLQSGKGGSDGQKGI